MSASLALIALAPASAFAANQRTVLVTAPHRDDLFVRHISYKDLNLASLDGQKTLVGRVRGAVNDLCSDVGYESWEPGFNRCSHMINRAARPQIEAAFARASQIALTGSSTIPEVDLALTVPAQ